MLSFSNYRGILLVSITYNTLYNILLSRLTPYVEKIIGDRHIYYVVHEKY
jgi:hypothetical protein